jgi:myo-inositol-1(or 4)-monophosphatase
VSDDELLYVAVAAARAAGELLVARFGALDELTIDTKSTSTDPVSEADREAEEAIRAVLAARRPDDAIMGEEGEDTPGTSGLRWIVDPLDGTVNFLYGIPMWCVSVACEDRVGVVHDPVREETFTVVAGAAPALNGAPLAARSAPPLGLPGALVATGFGYDAHVRAAQATVVARVLPRVRDVRRAGSAALDLAWCAAGRVDAYYERGVKPWDVAAGTLLCAGVGLDVRALEPDGVLPPGVAVAPATIADDFAALVA